jgi:hypothetical protein
MKTRRTHSRASEFYLLKMKSEERGTTKPALPIQFAACAAMLLYLLKGKDLYLANGLKAKKDSAWLGTLHLKPSTAESALHY